jgi:arginase family enzyme
MRVKIFGAALDALDDPERVELKKAYIAARAAGSLLPGLPQDPYAAIAPTVLARCGDCVISVGRLEIPAWLSPRPALDDASLVSSERYGSFLDSDEIGTHIDRCAAFVDRFILPDIPCMIAADHAMSAGPLKALSSRYGPRGLAVLIIDSHFDAIPLSSRMPQGHTEKRNGAQQCGSFLAMLLDEGVVLAENLFVVGVSDYPTSGTTDRYNLAYHALTGRGVTVIPKNMAESTSLQEQLEQMLQGSSANRLYVSLDADIGACLCMNAVRFLDTEGVPEEVIIALARSIRKLINTERFSLAGLDVAEVDVHLLGLDHIQGRQDRTVEVCSQFIIELVRG